MHSLVLTPQKTQLLLSKVKKSKIKIQSILDYPSIFISIMLKDTTYLREVFQNISQDLEQTKDRELVIVLCQDFFQTEEISLNNLPNDPGTIETQQQITAFQTEMEILGDRKIWTYILRQEVLTTLDELAKEFNFKIIAIKSSTEALLTVIGDLTSETFILSFGRENLDIDFSNTLTGLNKFSLPFSNFPKEIKEWNLKYLQEELNLHSKAKDTIFSHKLKSNLNPNQKLYIANQEILAIKENADNLSLLQTLRGKKILKSKLSDQELSSALMGLGGLLSILETKYYKMTLPPGFTLNKLNFAQPIIKSTDGVQDHILPRRYSPIRHFCRGIGILCLMALFFMVASVYNFHQYKEPSDNELQQYTAILSENTSLKPIINAYKHNTGNSIYYNNLIQQLYLYKLGENPYAHLKLHSYTITPSENKQDPTIIELNLQGDVNEVRSYVKYLQGNHYFTEINIQNTSQEAEESNMQTPNDITDEDKNYTSEEITNSTTVKTTIILKAKSDQEVDS